MSSKALNGRIPLFSLSLSDGRQLYCAGGLRLAGAAQCRCNGARDAGRDDGSGGRHLQGEGTPILEAKAISLQFGGVKALSDVSFHVRQGELFSIIGPNGAGKTSMLNCISGRYSPTAGQVFFKGRDITRLTPNQRAPLGLGRTFQNLALFSHMTVLDNIMVGRHHLLKNNFVNGALYWFGGAQKEELEHRRHVEDIIDFLEISHIRKAVAGTLSYGLRKRVELARAIAVKPDLILLDDRWPA